jgi:hypothetical protein
MNKVIYIGYVFQPLCNSNYPVSLSNISKQNAGDLVKDWLKENDPDNLDYIIGGVWSIGDSDYINLKL